MGTDVSGNDHPVSLVGSRAVFVYALLAAITVPAMLSMGGGGSLSDRILEVVFITLKSAWIPLVYLLGSFGLGSVARRWTKDLSTRWVVELGVGLTLTLSLSHGLGVLGVLNPISAWIVTGVGCLMLIPDFRNDTRRLNDSIGNTAISLSGIVFVVGSVLVVLMALNPPGTGWDSEYNGYDALSYHLELPREWLEAGQIWPSAHNVYSFLPSYFESAYVHMANLANAPKATPAGLSGLLDNDAQVVMGIHLFSALLVIVSAIAMRSVVRRAIELYLPESDALDRDAGLLARALLVTTPWLVVVGSMSYNEMGVVLLGISAIAVAIERDHRPLPRSAMAALIVAGACSVKPTAIFLLAPPIAALILATIPSKRWIGAVVLGLVVGVLTLAPWLIRNEVAIGNPVFPQMSSVFGGGDWSPAQLDTYRSAHHYGGSLTQRLAMLVVPDADGFDTVSRWRGWTNPQWGLTPWIGVLGCALLIAKRRTRRLGLGVAGAVTLATLGWLMLTHLQSRFLVPIAPWLIGAGALGLASIGTPWVRKRAGSLIAAGALLWMILIVARQSAGNPFLVVDLGPALFTGEFGLVDAPWTAKLNETLEPGETVYLLGDATPFYIRSPMVYNTVYDGWLIEKVSDREPEFPERWSAILQSEGIDIVVVSFFELNRFEVSGWFPASIDPDRLNEWIESLGEPIYVWTLPGSDEQIRAAFRLEKP